MANFLEVIVTSPEDAIEAEAGGADRVELVRALEVGGLTPEVATIRAVLEAVSIPVRVMLRESPTLSLDHADHLARMVSLAAQYSQQDFSKQPINGLVLGFVKNHSLDIAPLVAICAAAPACRITFHRAFDEIADPNSAIARLRAYPQVDRILTTGGGGGWEERKSRLLAWQQSAQPSIQILTGAGLCSCLLADLASTPELREVHVGRAARLPQTVSGAVSRDAVRAIKSALL